MREKIISDIDEFGGIEKFVKCLHYEKKFAPERQRILIGQIAVYYSFIYAFSTSRRPVFGQVRGRSIYNCLLALYDERRKPCLKVAAKLVREELEHSESVRHLY